MKSFLAYFRLVFIVSLAALLLGSCSIRRHIPKNEHLLRKVKIKIKPASAHVYSEELYALAIQKPNNSILGLIRPNMWFYIWASPKKREKNEKEKLDKGSWEKPVLLDSSLLDASAEHMESYLFSQGYFYANATYKVRTPGRKAKIKYKINAGKQFHINKIDHSIADKRLEFILRTDTSVSVLKPGIAYNADIITRERDRITSVLRNNGYYNFSREYIYYNIDTALEGELVNVGLRISTPPGRTYHLLYNIRSVFLEPEFYGPQKALDTSQLPGTEINIIGASTQVKTSIITDQIYFQKNEMYSLVDYQRTLNRLAQLKVYKFIDIQFYPDTVGRGDTAVLDVLIRLTPLDKQEIRGDIELNTTEENLTNIASTGISQRYYGTALSLVYRNRNLFRRAMQLEIRPRFAIEVPTDAFIKAAEKIIDTPSFEYGLGNSLIFPKLLFPGFKLSRNASNLYTQTAINLNALYEKNKYFQRTTFNTNLTYLVNPGKIRHFITPVELSFVNTDFLNDTFAKNVFATGDPLLINLFDQHLITDFRYSFIYNQPILINPVSKYQTFRYSFEIGGNIPALLDNIFDLDQTSDRLTKELFEVSYYQYLKNEVELRLYRPVLRKNTFVFRGIVGLGLPYGNSRILPFEKRFSVGGANSMRAWQLRELGPGSFKNEDAVHFDNTGDIKIEFNTEYRFPMYKWFHGAFFIDAGNVWTYIAGDRTGAKFYLDSFYRQVAVATGYGLRLDFSFFVVRFDFALPAVDPVLPAGDKLVIRRIGEPGWVRGNLNMSLGIGYPF